MGFATPREGHPVKHRLIFAGPFDMNFAFESHRLLYQWALGHAMPELFLPLLVV